MQEFDLIQRQLIWNRLISAIEEQAQTVIRTAFSQSVRECGDLSAGVFNRQGEMIAQAVTGTPGHVNAMAICVKHFIDRFPIDTMRPGDVFCTNDPWLSVGHYHDVTVVTPAFHKGRAVGLLANTCHIVDMGGRGLGPDARQCYEEGINIPIMHLAREGKVNEDLMSILRTNVRNAGDMEGDFYAMMNCNDDGARRLAAMLAEFGLEDIEEIGRYIMSQSRKSIETAIAAIPDGVYEHVSELDGFDEPIRIQCKLTVSGSSMEIDYSGSSDASPFGINVVSNFCLAYTVFGVNCVIAPKVPCNAGSIGVVSVSAPEGCILNAQRPMPVSARHVIGQMLPDVVFGCLAQAMPDRVPAEGAGAMWNPMLRGGRSAVDPEVAAAAGELGPDYDVILFNTGGTGGRPTMDGMTATAFPSGVRTPPVEAVEATFPVIIWRKEFREDSGGAGLHRGGLGQVLEIGGASDAPFSVAAMFDRTWRAAEGRHGGLDGKAGIVRTASGRVLKSKGRQTIGHGERLVLEMPGGGGYGPPMQRQPETVREDVLDGLVAVESARRDYGVEFNSEGEVDLAATEELRRSAGSASCGE
ncbi:MAG: hydantoinase B/oxoprolinase family protein [Rhodobacteraceae bacterium]|nr:hydantoinase B/oxoprolinase family protein [Paracoccaceae bacterium]